MKPAIFLLIFCFTGFSCLAQAGRDSVSARDGSSRAQPAVTNDGNVRQVGFAGSKPDSLLKKPGDSLRMRSESVSLRGFNEEYIRLLSQHPYYNFLGKPRSEVKIKRSDMGKDGLFYLLVAVLLCFALVRLLFGKYIANLFLVFFRVSLKQKQIREQLQQSTLPSLLLNIFFILSGGIYVSFLLNYYRLIEEDNLWYLILYSVLALGVVYLGKFMILKIMGWVFNIHEATDTYIFVVFLVNKLLGIFLLPFSILLAFSNTAMQSLLITLSFAMISILFAYRYIISYDPVRKEIKVSQFHFILYLCAFEITPLLLIYKALLTFL